MSSSRSWPVRAAQQSVSLSISARLSVNQKLLQGEATMWGQPTKHPICSVACDDSTAEKQHQGAFGSNFFCIVWWL